MAYSSFKQSGLDGFKTKKIKRISGSPPQAPTGISATDTGTNRAYNNGSASVYFTPPIEGEVPTSYRVLSTPGSIVETGTTSPIVITGLQSNTQYTFVVNSVNSVGLSEDSLSSNLITATTVPEAPTITSVTHGFEKVSVAFTTNGTGGKAISSYNAIPNTGSSQSGGSSPINVTSLTAGTSYTFTATATNDNGVSAASSISNSATPFTATGGTITTYSGFRSHTFTGTSNFTVTGNSAIVDYLVVAGGGAGGSSAGSQSQAGGGGGAGGFREVSAFDISNGTYAITIGGGGPVQANNSGGKGQDSSFGSLLVSTGGGGGGRSGGVAGNPGGSGGGAGQNSSGGAGNTPSTNPSQGNNGGTSAVGESGGGGGGAGFAGTASPKGGDGKQNSFRDGNITYYAGGGGAANRSGNGQNNSGGLGGGGNGGTLVYGNGRVGIQAGVANTGGGGGGSGRENGDHLAAAGGSGIVVIRYAT